MGTVEIYNARQINSLTQHNCHQKSHQLPHSIHNGTNHFPQHIGFMVSHAQGKSLRFLPSPRVVYFQHPHNKGCDPKYRPVFQQFPRRKVAYFFFFKHSIIRAFEWQVFESQPSSQTEYRKGRDMTGGQYRKQRTSQTS